MGNSERLTKQETIENIGKKALDAFDRKRYKDAIIHFNRILNIKPHNLFALVNKGGALSNWGKYPEALKVLNKALKINPKDVLALENKAITLEKQKKHGEALKYFDKVLKIEPKRTHTKINKWFALKELQIYNKEFHDYLNLILKIAPNDQDALVLKANYLKNKKRYSEAIIYYQRALRVHRTECPRKGCSRESLLLNYIASCHFDSKQYPKAAKNFNRVLKNNPKDKAALLNKGTSLLFSKKYKSASKVFDDVLGLSPNSVPALYWKVRTLLKLKDYASAIEQLDKLIKLDKKHVRNHREFKQSILRKMESKNG